MIWVIADRFSDDDRIGAVVTGFALQAAVLYVPFFLLERSAVAVGARRSPLRLAYALGVVLLVHIQGLGGLPTLVETTDIDRFGRIAVYLALAAVLELILTIAITDASTLIADASEAMADKHNFLADQRLHIDDSRPQRSAPSPGAGRGLPPPVGPAGRSRRRRSAAGDRLPPPPEPRLRHRLQPLSPTAAATVATVV